MAVAYENFVLESKLSSLLNTKMNTRSLMTIDESLAEVPGLKKIINVYTYVGSVENVAEGATNATRSTISFTPVEYEVAYKQQVFDYTDEQIAQDPQVLDKGMEGAAITMVNDLNSSFFTEAAKATLGVTYTKGGVVSYDTFVDAIAEMNLEDESNLFIVIPLDMKAAIRKDADFITSRQGEILYTGQIGSIAGVPVVASKLCPEGVAYVADKSAVTMFVKKESEIETERDKEKRTNTLIMRKVGLVALTDATKIVKITEALV